MPSQIRLLILVFLLASLLITGMAAVLRTTPLGLGLGNDAVAYIAGARSLLAGEGYRRIWLYDREPITHYPPLLSLLLASIGVFGIDPLVAAHGLVVGLYGLNGLLTGLVARQASGSNVGLLLAVILYVSNPSILELHRYAMSEPLYLALSLATLLTIGFFIRYRSIRWITLSGVFISLAFLTRYVGLALLATTISTMVFLLRDHRILFRSSALLLVSAFPLMLAWLLRNALLTGTISNRQVLWHPVSSEKIRVGIDRLWSWLVPGRVFTWIQWNDKLPFLLTCILLLAGLVVIFTTLKSFSRQDEVTGNQDIHRPYHGAMLLIVLLYTYFYLLMVLFSMSFFDAATSFENRIIMPVYISFIIFIAVGCVWLWRKETLIFRLAAAGIFLLYAGFFLTNQVRWIESNRHDSEGFASRIWLESPVLAKLRAMPESTTIYTKEPTLVYIRTGRPVYALPTPYDTALAMARPDFEQEVLRVNSAVAQGGSVMVFLGTDWQEESGALIWHQQLTDSLHLVARFKDGEIYSRRP